MKGLAFPQNAVSDRETSYEYGTLHNNEGDISINPAPGVLAIDPALMDGGSGVVVHEAQLEVQHQEQHPPLPDLYDPARQYSEGPQGDPFAPQPPPTFFPVEAEESIPPQKPVKRKKRPRKEEICGFCDGDDIKNKKGLPETMITCDECGRSGHPSCMELPEMGDVLRSYPWKCIECKNCEVCKEKGAEEHILFCDSCDRGWHTFCLRIEGQPPPGKWYCPLCTQYNSQPQFGTPLPPPLHDMSLPHDHMQTPIPIRESSVASSSRSTMRNHISTRSKGKGKARAISSDEEEGEEDEEVDIEEIPKPVRGKTRPTSYRKNKGRISKTAHFPDDDPPVATPRHTKRVRVHPPSPTTSRSRRVRLHVSEDEEAKGLFDDILEVKERDTSETSILNMDKQRFERSRILVEQKLAPLVPPPHTSRGSEVPDAPTPGPSRPLRSSTLQQIQAISTSASLNVSASPAPSTPGPHTKSDPATLRIRTIRFGDYDIKTWYDAPFPEEYTSIPDGMLWICEFCLKYMKSRFAVQRHRLKCKSRHPPGDEIYRDGSASVFEVDGRKNKIYCQNLCLLSKMFLDHKSLFYDVEPFLFYVMTEIDEFGARFVGYFSKEKRSPKDYNVSCIMTLPVRQRRGWGNMLIDFSYLLSKKEGRAGSPEKPLSGLGALGYKNYWTLAVMRYLETAPDAPRLEDISTATSMTIEDIFNTLTQQNMITARESPPPPVRPSPGQSIKFPKGRRNGIARRHLQRTQTNDSKADNPKGPFVAPTRYKIIWDRNKVKEYLNNWEAKGYFKIKPDKLQWSPYILARSELKGEERKEQLEKGISETDRVEAQDGKESALANTGDPKDMSALTAEMSTPNGMPYKSPLGLFDDEVVDDLPVFTTPNVQKSRSRSRSRSRSKSQSSSPSSLAKGQENGVVQELDDGVGREQNDETQQESETPAEELPSEVDLSLKRPIRGRPNKATKVASSTHKQEPRSPVEPRITRRRGVVPVSDSLASGAVDGDKALAARLALEERNQGRNLRSRASTSGEQKRPSSTLPVLRTMSPRKRRRIDSPAEDGRTASAETSPSVLPIAFLNGKHRKGKVNGKGGDDTVPVAIAIIADEEGRLGKLDILDDDDDDKKEREEIKPEEIGTPLTSLPSDDTVFVMDGVMNGMKKTDGWKGDGLDVDVDVDADGESEVDAEGEEEEEEEE